MLVVTKSKTEDKDKGRLKILKALSDADGAHVDVGLFEGELKAGPKGEAEYGELNIAQIGAVHEFGYSIKHGRSGGQTIVVPERSFLRSNHDERAPRYRKQLDRLYDRILRGKQSVLGALTGFGERVAGDVRRQITLLSEPPISEAAKKNRVVKGTTNPLIDTGTLRQSIRSRVLLHGSVSGQEVVE